MLYLILASAGGGKTTHITNLIEQFSAGGHKKLSLVVPEQFSFTSEKTMLGKVGEKAMAEHLASLDASAFVLDYDYNAPNAEHLQATHYPLYERIRSTHKDTPILFISKPDFEYDGQSAKRRAVIIETYEKAKANGDKNVAFIDGETLFGTFGRDGCTVDTCHPNDLGFYRMAETVYPVLKALLK